MSKGKKSHHYQQWQGWCRGKKKKKSIATGYYIINGHILFSGLWFDEVWAKCQTISILTASDKLKEKKKINKSEWTTYSVNKEVLYPFKARQNLIKEINTNFLDIAIFWTSFFIVVKKLHSFVTRNSKNLLTDLKLVISSTEKWRGMMMNQYNFNHEFSFLYLSIIWLNVVSIKVEKPEKNRKSILLKF